MRFRDNELEGGGTLIQVFTGCGKGKTTAALGLSLRAAGRGLKVYIAQFLKCGDTGELKSLKKIKNITIEQFGSKYFVKQKPKKKDIEQAEKGFKKVCGILSQKKYDVVILDEINIALKLGLISCKDFLIAIKKAPKDKEIIMTGRFAPAELIKIADLVSEVKEVKHYFQKGIRARKGIEF